VPVVETETGLDGVRFAVVDLETSGLRPLRHHILQVAVLGVDARGNELDRWSTYVRPPRWPLARVGPRHIHGIRRRAVAGAPSLAEVLPQVAARVDGAVFTAHNAQFDLAFLRRQAARVGIAWPEPAQLCTLTLSRTLDPERTVSHRLGDVCRRYGVPHDNPHDALADAVATGAVLPYLLKDSGITSREQLALFAQPR
jgi:DNA polymerase-3 subunit epsilon